MKKKWMGFQIVMCICAALGWWGVLYPELVLTADTCRVYNAREEQRRVEGQDIYWELLKAGKGEIRFRSRLLAEWNKFMEAINESDQQEAAP